MKVGYLHLPSGHAPPDMGDRRPFHAVVVLEQETSPEWRDRVSDWLVDAGCLYMMAWGAESGAWDDSVDWASLARVDFGETPDDQFVMTTWRDDEPLSETFWFAANAARHPTVSIDETIIIDICQQERQTALTEMLREAYREAG